jgi:hypothetical protein
MPDRISFGILATVVLHVVCQGAAVVLTNGGLFLAPLFFGVTQIVYMIPAWIWARSQNKRELAKGLAIGAGIGALLNGICAAIVLPGLRIQ